MSSQVCSYKHRSKTSNYKEDYKITTKILFRKYLSIIRNYFYPRFTSHPTLLNISHHPTRLRLLNSTKTQKVGPPALIPHNHYNPPIQTKDKTKNKRMRIATLQFSPKLGDVAGNIQRADALLKSGGRGLGKGKGIEELKPDILVLSEMALTG